LAVAALGGSPDRLLKDLEWLGSLFDSLVIRDLRVLAQALDGEVYHYRDQYGVEVDAIVQLRDGRWGAIEIRLGPGQGRWDLEQAGGKARPPASNGPRERHLSPLQRYPRR
jgi:hypothetical protein